VAEDGTIEAIRIADAPGFALGVQWHAEYDPQRNPINARCFRRSARRCWRRSGPASRRAALALAGESGSHGIDIWERRGPRNSTGVEIDVDGTDLR